jgi:hypothetical protein
MSFNPLPEARNSMVRFKVPGLPQRQVDLKREDAGNSSAPRSVKQPVLTLLVLLVQKYKY